MPPDLLVFGNLLLDDVVHDDGTTRMGQPGGAALYAALGARLWGVAVGLVSVVGEDYPARVLETLRELGIEVDGVRARPGPTLRTWLLYEGRRRRVVHRLGGPTHAEVSPRRDDVPRGPVRAAHLAPMPLAVQHELAAALAGGERPLLSLDPYELLRDGELAAWRRLAAQIDLLWLGEDEMAVAGGLEEPEPVLCGLLGDPSGRPRLLLYKQGLRGGFVLGADGRRLAAWRPRPEPVVDPTGAGDAFAGGFLAGRLRGDPLAVALERGRVSAALALAGPGPEALLAARPAEAEALLAGER